MLYPVILAGGVGKRLWPASSQKDPKQFKALIGNKTLLQNTYDRVLKGFDKDKVFIVTGQNNLEAVENQLDINEKNILAEPEARDTSMAIGWAALHISQIDPEGIVVTINTDNFVKEEEKYIDIIKKGCQTIEQQPDKLAFIGIKPTYPETGYGHIELGEDIGDGVYKVKSLREKPELAKAKEYTESGNYLWSSSIFIFKAKQLLEWYKEFLPNTYEALMDIKQGKDLARAFKKADKISIDYGLLEELSDMLCLPADVAWADIGHWKSVRDVLKMGDQNVTNTKNIVTLDSKNNLLYSFSDKLIATVGVEDMILVETEDTIFLCPADRAHEVKDLLEEVKKKGLEKYL